VRHQGQGQGEIAAEAIQIHVKQAVSLGA
jgi:hypothetical protein